MIELSIIVPLYNTENYIARCLDSLLNQGFEKDKFEIIVINDESSDNGKEVVEKYVALHNNIMLFNQENQGLSATRNRGIKLSKGNYIYFIDSDDFIVPHILPKLIDYMTAKALDVFGFGIQPTVKQNLPQVEITKGELDSLAIVDGASYLSQYDYRNEAVWYIIRKQHLIDTKLNFIEGVQMADTIFTPNLLYSAQKITSIPHKVYGYFQRPNSVLNTTDASRQKTLFEAFIWSSIEQLNFYKKVKKENKVDAIGLKRIKNKQLLFVMFLLVRVVKSNMSLREIKDLLKRLRSQHLLPIKLLRTDEHNKLSYKILQPIVNNKSLFIITTVVFRVLKKA